MNMIIARIQVFPIYWKVRNLFSRWLFGIDRFGDSTRSEFETLKYTNSFYLQFVMMSVKGILLSALVILAAEILEGLLTESVNSIIPPLIMLDPDARDYQSLVGQIGATFLGIYFATFGIILSSSYSQIRSDVMHLILREKVNNVYSSFLINLTVLALIATGLNYIGYRTGYVVFFLIFAGGLISVLCFFELGKRLFWFFDVTRLVEAEIVPEIVRLISEVSKSGRRSTHLDNHRRILVSQRISTLRYLSFESADSVKQSSIPNLKVNSAFANLLQYYAIERPKIPQDSFWFKRVSRHPEWFLENDSSTSTALETDMHLFPKEEIDLRWFEEELLDGLLASFEQCLKQGDYARANQTLTYAQSANEALASLLLHNEGISFLERFSACVREHESAPELPLAEDKQKSKFEQISLHLSLSQASYMFTYEYLRSAILFAENLPDQVEGIKWSRPNFANFPAPLLDRLQNTKKRIEFENTVEGQALMPNGYIIQLTAMDFTKALSIGIEELIQEMRRTTAEAVKSLVAEKREFIATPILLSSFRSATQFSGFIDRLEVQLQNLYELEQYPEYEISKVDTPGALEEFSKLRWDLLAALCSDAIIGFLAGDLGESEELPDYFGHSYFLLAEECFNACEDNNSDRFKELFLAFGIIAQLAFSRFDTKKGQVSDEYLFSLLGTIAEDMLALTGYAIVFSEIHENGDFKKHVDDVWESLLGNAKDRQAHLRWIINISSALHASFFGAPRNLIRTSWHMKFEQVLRNQGFDDGMGFGRAGKEHPNPIVRSVAGIGSHQPGEAAVCLLLFDKIEGEFELPRGVANFKAGYEREVERG